MKQDGFWRQQETDTLDPLPWPQANDEPWEDVSRGSGQSAFLDKLALVESIAGAASYRGFSCCRLCGVTNGSRTFVLDDWQWPEGYRHYIEAHNVMPTTGFRRFVEEVAEIVADVNSRPLLEVRALALGHKRYDEGPE